MLKEMKRAVHFDFHTMPGVDNICEDFDAEKFAQQMAEANVGYINFFARCNIGFSYYPTKVGTQYPGLKINMLGDVVRECHKRGIGVTGYINAGLHHELAIIHPEWLQMTRDGKIYNLSDGGPSFFRNVCYNTPYRDHLLAEVKEVLELGVDGLFLDCMQLRPCYCSRCMRDMISLGIDTDDVKAVTAFAFEKRKKMCEDIRKIVPEDKRLFFNNVRQPHAIGLDSHYEVESLWSYDYFNANVAYARSMYDTCVYMNGRFQQAWGDFGGYKGKASVENDFYDAIMNGAVPMLGDHLHPARLAEPDIYRDLGEIYARVKEYEKWTDNTKFISEIAIITDDASLQDDKYHGAARLLSELKYSYDILDIDADISKYKVVILPDDINMTQKLKGNLSAYLKAGGKVISSGFAALTDDESGFALPEWDFEYLGKDTTDTSYFHLNVMVDGLADMDYSYYMSGIRMKAKAGNTSLADTIDGYVPNHGYHNLHNYRYVPPKEKNGNSAVLINKEENVAHISFPIFTDFHSLQSRVYKEIIRILLEKFMPDNLIKTTDMPSFSRITVTKGEDYSLLHVKVTHPEIRGNRGVVEEHTELLGGKTVAVKGEYKSVAKLPSEESIQSEIKDGYTYITLPQIVGYDMFILK